MVSGIKFLQLSKKIIRAIDHGGTGGSRWHQKLATGTVQVFQRTGIAREFKNIFSEVSIKD